MENNPREKEAATFSEKVHTVNAFCNAVRHRIRQDLGLGG